MKTNRLHMETRAQISIELIIVMAAVVAVVLLLVTQLQDSSEKGINKLSKKTKDIFDEIDAID
ncbi:MAG: hypothetical protein FJY86_03120 [Candidatus Diapherotrites archaeon]|uniref:Class III signal peptide-containing protein n=1 Tax=Candidatus Iainarchaeum sp. TaxID=3101447 RepID=A0A8T4CAZ7_9ARCH|nr:hypothetical protein [Candidatus Diapherotrites archaeon]